MKSNIIKLYNEHKNTTIPYLFFGVCTTIVYLFTYKIAEYLFKIDVDIATVIAWIVAVLFAYFTNRRWVFKSKIRGIRRITVEMLNFFASRLTTLAVDLILTHIFIKTLHWCNLPVKLVIQVLVVILNYLASKLIIFKKSGWMKLR